ncbi:unnamed protein product [Caenorhabditis brenneri]
MTTNLYNLDDDSMRSVLKYLEINEILTLRKVSFNIQWTIEEINPNFNIRSVCIALETNRIVLTIRIDRHWTIIYRDSHGGQEFQMGCLVSKRKDGQGVFLENEDYMDVFARDLEIILSNRKSVLEEFSIRLDSNEEMSSKLIRTISTALESNPRQLQVKEFKMSVYNQAQIFEIFRCINPDKLKTIKLLKPSGRSDSARLEVNGACELDQWKQAEILEMENLIVQDIHQNFTHFKRFDIKVDKITPDDLVFLKEELKKSADFVQANISYVSFNDQDNLIEVFPGFEYIPGTIKSCAFKFSETKRCLLFLFDPCMSSIEIQNVKELPKDAHKIEE